MIDRGQVYMKNKLVSLLLGLALTGLCFAQSNEQRETARNAQPLPAAKVEKIESAIRAWMELNKAPALSVAIVTDNQMRWSKGFGLADVENAVPARPDTAFRLA